VTGQPTTGRILACALALAALACRPSGSATAQAAPAGDGGAQSAASAVESCADRWLAARGLNTYGDPPDTVYAGGTPLFDERTGATAGRIEYLFGKHPGLRAACPGGTTGRDDGG
jgi:hypothetical protein